MLFVEVRLLPKPDRAWCLPTKSRVGSVEDSKVGFTATLVVPAVWGRPTHLQVCLNGLTSRCHPPGPLPFACSLTHSESGWASTATIVECLREVQNEVGEGKRWVLMWDAALVHISAETCAALREQFPLLITCMIERGCTGISQPLDVSYMKSLKAHLRKDFARALAIDILRGVDDLGKVVRKPEMKANIVGNLEGG